MRWVIVTLTMVGCFSPHPQTGVPCIEACPEGLMCSPATHTCEHSSIDAGDRDSLLIDAPRDAATADTANDASGDGGVNVMLVQQITNQSAMAASLSVTFAIAPVNGHVLVMIGGNLSGALDNVTGGGATWTRAVSSLQNGNIEIWFGITNGTSSTVTVARASGGASPMTMAVSEWSGLVTTTVLDNANATNGGSSPASAGSIVTTTRDLLLFAVAEDLSSTFGVPAPGAWTAMTGLAGSVSQLEWYRVEPIAGTIAPQVTESGHSWDAAIAALRVAP